MHYCFLLLNRTFMDHAECCKNYLIFGLYVYFFPSYRTAMLADSLPHLHIGMIMCPRTDQWARCDALSACPQELSHWVDANEEGSLWQVHTTYGTFQNTGCHISVCHTVGHIQAWIELYEHWYSFCDRPSVDETSTSQDIGLASIPHP